MDLSKPVKVDQESNVEKSRQDDEPSLGEICSENKSELKLIGILERF